MELSLFLAQLLGLTVLIYGVLLFIKPQIVKGMIVEVGQSALMGACFSFIGIIGGLTIILSHNIWTLEWPVIITVLGWGALIKGILYFAAPHVLSGLGDSLYNTDGKVRAAAFGLCILGMYLMMAGFGWL
jgi:hypothetical protein